MAARQESTIFALSSGALPAGVAVIRVSGPRSLDVLRQLGCPDLPPRKLQHVSLHDPAGELIDRGMAVCFPGPRSFTGEDSAELHLHGSRAAVARMLAVLGSMEGLRQAEPGEFTLRAFRNGKIDLTEAEALSDLIAAETERQRQLALAHASGLARELYSAWRDKVVERLAMVEAVLDFADEEDAPDELGEEHLGALAALIEEIDSHVQRFRQGQIIRDGYRVAIVGPPNAGKSSLLNVLAGRDVAIVTDEPGTTRDIVEVDLDLGGILIKLSDTAGLRAAEAKAEQIGVERALRLAREADLVLLVQDATCPEASLRLERTAGLVRLGNKKDLPGARDDFDLLISTRTGEGIDELLQIIESRAAEAAGGSDAIPFRERHVALLAECAAALRRGLQARDFLELQAEELRQAANCIGRITGRVDVEDLLDVIFSRFCIGK